MHIPKIKLLGQDFQNCLVKGPQLVVNSQKLI